MSIAEKLVTVAENEQKVFDAGKQAEYDRFWDIFQNKGKLTVYYMRFHCAMGSYSWDDNIYNPKYEINCTGQNQYGATEAFYMNRFITDTKVPINCSGVYLNNTFNGCVELKRIPLLRVDENSTYRQTFLNCKKLEELTVEGTIGQNNLNFQWSTKLSKSSILSVINALKDYSGTTETRALTLGTTNLAKLTDAEKAIATQKGWTLS